MFVIYYTDCMSIGPREIPASSYYPQMVQQKSLDFKYKVYGLSGATTTDSLEKLDEVLCEKPNMLIYGFGVNDALPRGLKRKTRSRLIKYMYNLKLNDTQRLWVRRYLLNPLEYVGQFLCTVKQYTSIEVFTDNLNKLIERCNQEQVDLILLNIAPVYNYRFVNADKYIEKYNDVASEICKLKQVKYIDVYRCFKVDETDDVLATDRFHYGSKGHLLVANEINKLMNDK